jgi:hypothetical protein
MLKKSLAGFAISIALLPAHAIANDGRVVTDIVVVASNDALPPGGPTGYSLAGYWDVDRGGAQGTFGSTGAYMMAMYVRRDFPTVTASCVSGVGMLATNASTVPSSLAPAWGYRGMWDMDRGGGRGNLNGSSGSYMMGLYTTRDATGLGRCVVDVVLNASNTAWELVPAGYNFAGSWDVDAGGGFGANGSSGSFMMTLATRSE